MKLLLTVELDFSSGHGEASVKVHPSNGEFNESHVEAISKVANLVIDELKTHPSFSNDCSESFPE